MRLSDLLEELAARGSTLTAEGGHLRHRGPRIDADDPLRRALATFYDEVLWLLTSDRLCVLCPRPLADGDRTLCAPHRRLRDDLPPVRLLRRSVTTSSQSALPIRLGDTAPPLPIAVGKRRERGRTGRRERGPHFGEQERPIAT